MKANNTTLYVQLKHSMVEKPPAVTIAARALWRTLKVWIDLIPMVSLYVARKGEVSAWDNDDFVKAVEATGRKTLIVAGVRTRVCVTFPALQAQTDGYRVYSAMDASGDVSRLASDAANGVLSVPSPMKFAEVLVVTGVTPAFAMRSDLGWVVWGTGPRVPSCRR